MVSKNMAGAEMSPVDSSLNGLPRKSAEEGLSPSRCINQPDVLIGSAFYCDVRRAYILPQLAGQSVPLKTPLSSPIQESFAAQSRTENFTYQEPLSRPRLPEEEIEVADKRSISMSKTHSHLNYESSESSQTVDSEILLPLLKPVAIEDELPSVSDRSHQHDLSTAFLVDFQSTQQRCHKIIGKRSVSYSPSTLPHCAIQDRDVEREEAPIHINREPPVPPHMQDYQLQLMLLELKNKKRFMVARAEQDSIIRCRIMAEEMAHKVPAENPLCTYQSGLLSPLTKDKTIPNTPSMATSIAFEVLQQGRLEHVPIDHVHHKLLMQLPLKCNEDADHLTTNSVFPQMDSDVQVDVRQRLATDNVIKDGTTGDTMVNNEAAKDECLSFGPQEHKKQLFLDGESDMSRPIGPQVENGSALLDQKVSLNRSKEAQTQALGHQSPLPRSSEVSKNTTSGTCYLSTELQETREIGVDYDGAQDDFERERVPINDHLHSYLQQPILLRQKNAKSLLRDSKIRRRKIRDNKEHANQLSPTFTLHQHCNAQEEQHSTLKSRRIPIHYQRHKKEIQEEERLENMKDAEARRETGYEQQQGCEGKGIFSIPTHPQPILDTEKHQARHRALERMRRMSLSISLPHKSQVLSAALSPKNIEQSQAAEENASLDSDDTMEHRDDVMDTTGALQQYTLPELYAPNLNCMDIWTPSVHRESKEERLDARARAQVVDSPDDVDKPNEKLASPISLTPDIFPLTQTSKKVTITTITTVTTVTTTTNLQNNTITETTIRSDTSTATSEVAKNF